ncbi:hypothetical protein NLG97_g3524 [Lecanicillium saksenae]|uniref:Uncharacterized protein n=1 Tax=Lecanicillium saksenae TaxID=468837 RepID=A0ACC1R1U4_9HYPO|nr:hypothetical protein NLG97_g3524 [Lecanicillium saksenae]
MLSAGEDKFEIFDLSPVPTIVVSQTLRVQRVSQGLVAAWGCNWANTIGNDLFTALYQGSATERFDRVVFARAIEVAIAAQDMRQSHAAYSHDGTFWTARIIPIFQGADLLCLIVEWEQAEVLQTRVSDAEPHYAWPWQSVDEGFRIFAQSVKDYALFLLDTRGYVTTWNIGAETIKGYKTEEIVGKHFSGFYGEDDLRAGKPEKELEVCLRDGRVEDEGWRYRKDGSRFWANVVITAIYKKGTHVGFGKVTRDLTERKNAELQLINAYEESSRLKNEFLANISHEIRTPMHGMLSASTLLLDTSLSEEQREAVDIIEESGAILLQIINNILDYSKIASGSVAVKSDMINPSAVIASTIRSVQATLPLVQIESIIAPDLPKAVKGDQLRYRQILQNLLDNAAKFTEKGSISVHAALTDEDEATCAMMTEVRDTGIGVPQAQAENLFKPFTQLDSSIKKRYQGTGLGLSIAKSLVELLDGQIGYRPNLNAHGSVFWFTVRFQKLSNAKLSSGATAIGIGAGSAFARVGSSCTEDDDLALEQLQKIAPTKQILAAEDNSINQVVLKRTLQKLGFKHVTMTSNGEEALARVLDPSQTYDLVLMDVNMPIMDGHKATVHIRNHGSDIPIIAMTAYALKGDMEKCLEQGMTARRIKKLHILESVVSPHGNGTWIGDLDILKAARNQERKPGPETDGKDLIKGFRNIPGVETCPVNALNLLQLAPGGHLGRFVVWTSSAFKALDDIYGSTTEASSHKRDFLLPSNVVSQADLSRLINSSEIQSSLNAPKGDATTKRSGVQKKNPLRNKQVMLRLNPYAKVFAKDAQKKQ